MHLDDTFLIVDSPPPARTTDDLQVADFQDYSYVAGPGRRCVVWLSGCHRRCPGCFQPHYFSFDAGSTFPVAEIAERILRINGIDGVTFSGGEPFEQSKGLAALCHILKSRSDLSLLSYTGYRLEWLRTQHEPYRDLLQLLDIVIDGEYRETEKGAYLWRGSRNQRVVYLNNRSGDHIAASPAIAREDIQITLTPSDLVVTGFPDDATSLQLKSALEKRGIILATPPEHAQK